MDMTSQLKCFNFAVERMRKAKKSLISEKDLYEAMGAAQSTYSTWKKRGKIATSALVNFCVLNDIDLNWFFKDASLEKNTDNLINVSNKQLLDANLVLETIRSLKITTEQDRDCAVKSNLYETAAKHEIESKSIGAVLSRIESGDFHINRT